MIWANSKNWKQFRWVNQRVCQFRSSLTWMVVAGQSESHVQRSLSKKINLKLWKWQIIRFWKMRGTPMEDVLAWSGWMVSAWVLVNFRAPSHSILWWYLQWLYKFEILPPPHWFCGFDCCFYPETFRTTENEPHFLTHFVCFLFIISNIGLINYIILCLVFSVTIPMLQYHFPQQAQGPQTSNTNAANLNCFEKLINMLINK